ncbi:MAG: hypothetical protein DRJ42_14035 [Deltaproteobacteria bacterium]|nr:MAG: hypothetical protein DRJ42_14035 [Deltaproteobacteria bacterium]
MSYRALLLLPLWSVVCLPALVGCGDDAPANPDASLPLDARVEVVGAPAVNLRYGATTNLTVRYVDSGGTPLAGALLEWAIVGEAAGAQLAALQATTNADGIAEMTLTAGASDTLFTVEITPPVGTGATFDIAVADTDLGSITVNMTYPGSRALIRFDAFLFDGEDCAAMDPAALPTPLRPASIVSDLTARPAFAGVAPGATYAVAVVASTGTNVAAYGCADRVVVTADADTPVDVALRDVALPANFVGVWDLDNRFDFGDAVPPSVETFLDVIGELADDDVTDSAGDPSFELSDDDGDGISPEYGVDPGAFVIDATMDQTCHWECVGSEDYASCSELNHSLGDLELIYTENFQTWDGAQSRFRGGCGSWEYIVGDAQTMVNDQVAAALPDFAAAWGQLASDLARAITNAHFLSVLTIRDPSAGHEFEVPITHELVEMVVDFRDPLSVPAGAARQRTFLLADAGLSSLTIDDVSTVDGTTLTIPEHSFNMRFGQLTLYIYRNVLLTEIFGVSSTGALLATWVDCNQLATWLYDSIDSLIWPISVPVSVGTLEGYCTTALDAVGARLEAELAGSLDADGVLTIRGTVTGSDIDEDTGRVGALVDGAWSGSFTEGAVTGDVTGVFTGARAAE